MKNNIKHLCTNIYECKIARHFHLALPLQSKYNECKLCKDDDIIPYTIATEIILSCPICSEVMLEADPTLAAKSERLQKCFVQNDSYCPYCNCNYKDSSELDKDQQKQIAQIIKMFLAEVSMKDRIERFRKMIYDEDICKILCDRIHTLLELMKEGKKKKYLILKMDKTFKNLSHIFSICLKDPHFKSTHE